ncbi:MAG: hypothetical protein ACKOCI_03515 [Cyanobium sp.]
MLLVLLTALIGLALCSQLPWQPGLSRAGGNAPRALEQRQFAPYLNRLELLPPATADPRRTVTFGTHLENVYAVSLRDRSFRIEGWYWLRWPAAINTLLEERQIPPSSIIEFTNQIESSDMLLEPVQPTPRRLENGDFLQEFRFSVKLYISDINLHSFPFTDLTLPIIVEFSPDELLCSADNQSDCVGLLVDPGSNQGMLGEFVTINGYTTQGIWTQEFLHQYPTGFGRRALVAMPAIRLQVAYNTEPFTAFINYIFPLLVLMGIALMSPFLPAQLGDVRMAIPTTILLTLIFLQLGYRQELPPQAYLSYLDWLYMYAYLVAAVLFGLFCWSTHRFSQVAGSEQQAKVTEQIQRLDSLFQGLAGGTLVLLLLWMLRL